ncbi:MAG: hypothetical protein OIF50_04015 [Flavobacteriaceae bacterium]|nr:hypothetical protein [Flavobacteriaceae bacterium]
MLKSWLQVFIRNLKKRPLYPIINTVGLTIGITCFVLVSLYVSKEWSYEKWNPNKNQIYKAAFAFDNGEVWYNTP